MMHIIPDNIIIQISLVGLIGLLVWIVKIVYNVTHKYTKMDHDLKICQNKIDTVISDFNISEIRERLARIETMLNMIMKKK